jgi:ribosomal protein S18 acetylase RimI-like enzyme
MVSSSVEMIIPWEAGRLVLRPETPDDLPFRFALFCRSRPPEWDQVYLPVETLTQVMNQQFWAQTETYLQRFPDGRFDIIELDGVAIGRIVVNRPGDRIHIVDQAIAPERRNQGLGTAIMRALMAEAAAGGLFMTLKVSNANDPSMKLYSRLGFVADLEALEYIEMTWRPPVTAP